MSSENNTKETKKASKEDLSINPDNVQSITNLGYLSLKEG